MRKNKLLLVKKDVSDWIMSYIMILLIPILICSIFFIYSFVVTWKETRNLNASALKVVADNLDNMFTNAYNIEFKVQSDNDVLRVKVLGKNKKVSDNYTIKVAMNSIGDYLAIEGPVTKCTVFLPKMELWLGSGHYRVIEKWYKDYAATYDMGEEEFKELLFSRHIEKVFFTSKENNSLCYISSYPVIGKSMDMNVIVEMDMHYIQSVLASMDNMAGSATMILDKNGTILVERSDGSVELNSVDMVELKEQEYHTAKINGRSMLISRVDSIVTDVSYVSVIPYTIFWHRAINSLLVFVIALSACMILGLTAAWYFAKIKQNTYGRLNTLIKGRLKEQSNRDTSLKQKEIAIAIKDLVEEYESMQKQLDSADEKKRELILSSIIAGRIRNDETERVLRVNNVVAEFGNFAILILRSNQYGDLFDRADEQLSSTEMEKMAEAVAWVVKEIEKYDAVCEILRVAGNIVCICDFGSEVERDCEEKLLQMLESLKTELEKTDGHITISISAVHNQILSLNSAYAEAMRVMEYQLTDRKLENNAMNYSEMIKANQMCYLFTVEDEVEIMGLMKSGKSEEAVSKVNALCEKNILLFNGNHELANCLVMNLVSCVLQVENGMKNREKLSDPIIWMKQVTKIVSVYDRVELINQRIQQICSLIADTRANKDNDFVKQIQAYIMNNYQMEGLGNSEIADYFGRKNSAIITRLKRLGL